MMGSGPIAAAAVSSAAAFVEMCAARRKAPTPRATLWVIARLGIDAAVAALAYPLVVTLVKATWFVTPPWPSIISAFSGLAILRSQIAILGTKQTPIQIGFGAMYMRVTSAMDGAIDDIGSVAMSKWVTKALIAMTALPKMEIESRIDLYLSTLDRLAKTELEAEREFFRVLFKDEESTIEARCSAAVNRLLALGGRRCVRSLMKPLDFNPSTAAVPRPRSVTAHDSSLDSESTRVDSPEGT